MKTCKKTISALLAAIFLMGCLCISASAESYQITLPEEGDYYIVPEADENFTLDLTGGGSETYTYFQLWELNRSDAQIMHLEHIDGDWYKIVHKASGQVLNVESGVSRDDARLWLYPFDGTDACMFRFADTRNGSYLIQNKIDGRVLDLDNALCFNGSIVHLWNLHANLSARWKLIPVSAATMYVNTSSLNLNVRTAPSTSGTVIGKLARGTQVTVLASENGWKKVQSGTLVGWCSAAYLSSEAPAGSTAVSQTASSKQLEMANNALSLLGNTGYNGYCQRFVRVVGQLTGLPHGNASTALEACNKWRVSSSLDNIPVGAAVYLRSKNTSGAGYKYGHVGIYVGDGYVVHAQSTVKKQTLSSLLGTYHYLGWGWQAGVDLR